METVQCVLTALCHALRGQKRLEGAGEKATGPVAFPALVEGSPAHPGTPRTLVATCDSSIPSVLQPDAGHNYLPRILCLTLLLASLHAWQGGRGTAGAYQYWKALPCSTLVRPQCLKLSLNLIPLRPRWPLKPTRVSKATNNTLTPA